jgi:hypothetical protein
MEGPATEMGVAPHGFDHASKANKASGVRLQDDAGTDGRWPKAPGREPGTKRRSHRSGGKDGMRKITQSVIGSVRLTITGLTGAAS